MSRGRIQISCSEGTFSSLDHRLSAPFPQRTCHSQVPATTGTASHVSPTPSSPRRTYGLNVYKNFQIRKTVPPSQTSSKHPTNELNPSFSSTCTTTLKSSNLLLHNQFRTAPHNAANSSPCNSGSPITKTYRRLTTNHAHSNSNHLVSLTSPSASHHSTTAIT